MKKKIDSLIETIEIMNDKELMEGIKRSINDANAGRVKKIRNLDNIFE